MYHYPCSCEPLAIYHDLTIQLSICSSPRMSYFMVRVIHKVDIDSIFSVVHKPKWTVSKDTELHARPVVNHRACERCAWTHKSRGYQETGDRHGSDMYHGLVVNTVIGPLSGYYVEFCCCMNSSSLLSRIVTWIWG